MGRGRLRPSKGADDLLARLGEISGQTALPGGKVQAIANKYGIDLHAPDAADSVYRMATKEATGQESSLLGPAKEYVPPQRASESRGETLSLDERLANDPNIARAIQGASLPPELVRRIQAGDRSAIPEAYRLAVQQGDRPARQMELPLNDGPTGMIPFGVRGPGVPIGLSGPGVRGGLSGPGVPGNLSGPGVRGGQMIPSRPGALSPQGPRGMSPVDADFIPDADGLMVRNGGELATQGPLQGETIPRQGVAPPYRQQPRTPDTSGRNSRIAAAVAAGVLSLEAARRMMSPEGEESSTADPEGLTDTSGAADLHDEQAPAPRVETPPQPTAEMYFSKARELIDQLNQMRRNAGGEVPEARQMMAQINKLQEMGNQMRNSPSWSPTDTGDPGQQAQMLIRDLNARRQKAGREVPEAPQIMAEVRRLQAMSDQQKNSRYGRSGSFTQQYPRSA